MVTTTGSQSIDPSDENSAGALVAAAGQEPPLEDTLSLSAPPVSKRRKTSSFPAKRKAATPAKPKTASAKTKPPALLKSKPATSKARNPPSTSAAAAAAAAAVACSKKPTAALSKKQTTTIPAPTHILLIDNGGDTVKFGWNDSAEPPKCIPNVTARLQQQWTVLVADQLSQIQNPNQLTGLTRSMERGILVNLGNQVQVWKRVLDLAGVALANAVPSETARAFGWKFPRTATSASSGLILPQQCAVVLTVPPLCPRGVLDQICLVWMQDFGFSHVGLCTGPLICAQTVAPHNPYETACLIDLGWSATYIVPTYKSQAISQSTVRRLAFGARHLIKIWQYHCSYRQWNLMDQEFLLRACLEQTSYVSLDFKEDMRLAKQWPQGLRPYDRDFVLPDYQTTFEGHVQLPPALERRLRQEAKAGQEGNQQDEDEDEDSSDEDIREEDMNEEDVEDLEGDEGSVTVVKEEPAKNKKNKKKSKALSEEGDNDDSDEEEDEEEEDDEEALRKRLLKEREEEEKRKRMAEQEQQLLRISVERFAIPEALFYPSDVGLPQDWAGLPRAIQQAVDACPEYLRAAMYRSIYLVGGLSQLQNLKPRLQAELRALVPWELEIHIAQASAVATAITSNASPTLHCWYAMQAFTTKEAYVEWSISKQEWESCSRRGAWRRLAVDHGGKYII